MYQIILILADLKKTNSNPSFDALHANVADIFIKNKGNIDQKSYNAVLEQLINFAKRAKQSSVLDIDAHNNILKFVDKPHNNLSTVMPGSIETIKKVNDEIMVTLKELPSYDCNYLSAKSNLKSLGFEEKNEFYQAPLKKFFDTLTSLFNTKEAEIVDQIETDKVTQTLIEQLGSLIIKSE